MARENKTETTNDGQGLPLSPGHFFCLGYGDVAVFSRKKSSSAAFSCLELALAALVRVGTEGHISGQFEFASATIFYNHRESKAVS